jgi:hypothetical protein
MNPEEHYQAVKAQTAGSQKLLEVGYYKDAKILN